MYTRVAPLFVTVPELLLLRLLAITLAMTLANYGPLAFSTGGEPESEPYEGQVGPRDRLSQQSRHG